MKHLPPKIAIIEPNTLAAMGLKQLLETLVPGVTAVTFGSMSEFQANTPELFAHFFVSMNVVLEHRQFFVQHSHRTIVLTMQTGTGAGQLKDFNSLCSNVPEANLVRQLLALVSHGHPGGRNLPMAAPEDEGMAVPVLSDREAEVMVLIVQGYINKEIAGRLHIGLSTVVTHRKNIMEKLGLKSVSALTMYAVMHGYVDINKI